MIPTEENRSAAGGGVMEVGANTRHFFRSIPLLVKCALSLAAPLVAAAGPRVSRNERHAMVTGVERATFGRGR